MCSPIYHGVYERWEDKLELDGFSAATTNTSSNRASTDHYR